MWPYTDNLVPSSWSEARPAFDPMLQIHRNKIDAWEQLIEQLLASQTEWSDTVTTQASHTPGIPESAANLFLQMNELTGNVIRFQAHLWNQWFTMLKGMEAPLETKKPQLPTATKPATRRSKPKVVQLQPPESQADAAVEAVAEAGQENLALVLDEVDDLKAIFGVGPALERKLLDAGVKSYRQIASWTASEIAEIEDAVMSGRFSGRIQREDWVGQAKALHESKLGQTD